MSSGTSKDTTGTVGPRFKTANELGERLGVWKGSPSAVIHYWGKQEY